jgi:hypothetical protein
MTFPPRTPSAAMDLPRFVLANRPGFPFLGNDLLREADAWNFHHPQISKVISCFRSRVSGLL